MKSPERGQPLLPRLALALLVLAGGCGAPEVPEPDQGEVRSVTRWGALGSWTGQGGRQTESFDVTSGALRLKWQTANEVEPGNGRLRVALHSAISGRPLETIVDVEGVGRDSIRLAAGQRVAYLLIESTGIDWRITLEEGVTVREAVGGDEP